MADNFFSGFAEGFNSSRRQKSLREQLRLQDQARREKAAQQDRQFNQQMDFRQKQADDLNAWRLKQNELEERKMDLQKKQADLNVTGAMMKAFDPAIPKPAREFLFTQMAPQLGIDPKSDQFQQVKKMFMGFDDEALGNLRTSIGAMLPDAQPGEVTAFAQSILSGQMTLPQLTEAMGNLATRKSQQSIIDGLTGDQSNADVPAASGGRLLSPEPMAQQPPGGNLPVPGMPSTEKQVNTKAQGGMAKDPSKYREGAMKAFRVGNTQLGNSLLQAARDIEGGGTKGTIGDIPAGYEMTTDEQGNRAMRPIAGSPAAQTAADAQKKTESQASMQKASGNIVIQDSQRALDMLGGMESYPSGAQIAVESYIPGNTWNSVSKLLDSVRANTALERLQEMRQASPTGGALGNVSDKDMATLERAKGNLDITLDPPILMDNIRRVQNLTKDIVYGTPDQIAKQVKEGKISAEDALPLLQREKLSFDEMGKPVKEEKKSSPAEGSTSSAAAGEKYSEGEVRYYQKKPYRFKGGDPYDQKNWEEIEIKSK